MTKRILSLTSIIRKIIKVTVKIRVLVMVIYIISIKNKKTNNISKIKNYKILKIKENSI
jgi:hypothetical protein